MACILKRAPILCRAACQKNIIHNSLLQVIRVRNYGHFSPNKSDTLIEKRFKLKDSISDDYKLIYREHKTLNATIIISYYSGWFFSTLGILILGYILIKDPPIVEQEEEIANKQVSLFSPKTRRIFIVLSTVALPITLVMISRAMPFRIYYSPSQKLFKAVFVSNILRRKQIKTFSEGSAIPMFKRSRFMADSLFKINGHTTLLDRDSFAVQAIREKMICRTL